MKGVGIMMLAGVLLLLFISGKFDLFNPIHELIQIISWLFLVKYDLRFKDLLVKGAEQWIFFYAGCIFLAFFFFSFRC